MADKFSELPGGLESPEHLRVYILELLERIDLLEERLAKVESSDVPD